MSLTEPAQPSGGAPAVLSPGAEAALAGEQPLPGPLARWAVRLFWVVPLALYLYTACPGTAWIDGPMIANNVMQTTTGTWVNVHNLFHLLGRVWTILLPFRHVHYSLNLLCGVMGAVTVHFIFLSGYRLTRNLFAASLGGIALALSHSLWWHSTVLEVYTLNTAILAIMLYFVVRYDETRRISELYKAVFCLGLGATNHVLMGLFVFAFIALWLPKSQAHLWRPRVLLGAAFCFLVGFQLFLFVFLTDYSRELNKRPVQSASMKLQVLEQLVHDATGGDFKAHMFPELSPASRWKWRLNYLFTLFMNYPSLAFVLGCIGLWAFARMRGRRLSLIWFLVAFAAQVAWSSNYMIWDMYAFGLPVWVLFGLLVIVGADWALRAGRVSRYALLAFAPTILLPPLLYAAIADWGHIPPGGLKREEAGFWQRYFSQFTYVSNVWDPARYFADPNKRDYDTVDRVADQVFGRLPQGAHLFDDDGKGYYPLGLYHQKVLGRRRDIQFHSIFGPFLDSAKIEAHARELQRLLARGEKVYISSPYWPERPVLNHLYALLTPGGKAGGVGSWPAEHLEQNFPRYYLKRVPISDTEPLYIYEFVPRDGAPPR